MWSERALGWGAEQNGYIYAYMGVVAVVVQGLLVGPLTRLLGERRFLGDAGQAHVAMPLRLDISGAELQHEGQPLPAASLQAGRLLRLCKERSIESLAFDPELDGAELLRFLVLLNTSRKRDAFDPDKILAALGTAGVRHVLVSLAETPAAAAGKQSDDTPSRLADYQAMADCLQDNHVRAYHGRSLDVDNVMGNVDHVARDLGQGPSGLLSLATQDNIDSFTVGWMLVPRI